MGDGIGIGITGLGVSVPLRTRRNDQWELPPQVADFTSSAPSQDPFRGTVERRVLEDDRESTDLEIEACRSAMEIAGLTSDEIPLLVGFSQNPRSLQPNNHGPVARGLELLPSTTMMTIDASCASFVVQLQVARAMLVSGESARALLYQSSVISRTTDYGHPLSPMSGDGAVAEVVAEVPAGLGLVGIAQGIRPELCDGLVLATTDGRPRWTDPAGEGARYYARVADLDAAETMARHGPEFARQTCRAVLEKHGYRPDDVDLFACTLPTAWFGDACAEAVGIRPDRVVPRADHFERYAHLMAASAPLNLWVAWQSGRLAVGDLVLTYVQGSGFTHAAVLMRWAIPPAAGG